MKKVLVVDNHPVILKFMRQLLEKEGHQVVTAKDGLSALDALKTFAPDICFIDLIMENIDGEKLCRIIRDLPQHKDTFIVILSAIAAEEREPFNKYHADAFVAKGPLKQMSGHVLQIMNSLETADRRQLKGKVLGKEQIYAREITKELLDTKEHHETALNHMSEGFLELLNERIIYANPAAISIVGIAEEKLLNTDFRTLFFGNDKKKVDAMLGALEDPPAPIAPDEPFVINDRLVLIKMIPVSEDRFQSTLVILGDITRQKQLETQVRNAQKMEALGTLAGGVAHDLNNILTGIVSYPDLLLMQLPEDSPLKKPIQTIKKSGEKAARIVQDLLTLARRNVAHKETVDLNSVINDYLKSPEYRQLRLFHPEVDIDIRLEDNLLNCYGSAVHLSKVIMNLISNAVEAITTKGTVVVSTENQHIGDEAGDHQKIDEGEYICLKVADDGIGISPEDRERIFEPFYTKKKMGRSGTGLGMAVVWGTVRDHRGHLDVDSTMGEGTCVTVYLPATREQPAPIEDPLSIQKYKGDNESILIVDDVKDQHEVATHILETLGYQAFSAYSGEDAVEFLHNHQVDLVLLDMIMDPGMDGFDTYKEIIKRNPEQKVILVSGFSETARIRAAQKLGAGAFIRKPYTVEKIGQAIKNALA